MGLAAEANLARGLGGSVATGGGGASGAAAAAERLVGAGADRLLSFGLAGGLAPGLPAGALVIPLEIVDGAGQSWLVDRDLAARFGEPAGSMLGADHILATRTAKRAAWDATGALAADIESGAAARVASRHGVPFAVLRSVCDPAERDLPPAALTALDAMGRIRPAALLRSLARSPGQIPALIALGREAARARNALLACVTATGPIG